jgi:DNA-directed RNA polymerase specialized sigma24 family protein
VTELDTDTLERAKAGSRPEVEAVINACFPPVHRVAHALTGDPKVAASVVKFVLKRGINVMPRWRSGIIPENWFLHQTVLILRRVTAPVPPPDRDLLITAGPATDPAYAAFIRTLRELHGQQAEAFILHHGEKMNTRLLGVAMDCSTQAAAGHLSAATDKLQTLVGERFDELTKATGAAYMSLTPPETIIHGRAIGAVGKAIWRKRIGRMLRRLFWLAVLAGVAYAVWRWQVVLLEWFQMIREKAMSTTRPG